MKINRVKLKRRLRKLLYKGITKNIYVYLSNIKIFLNKNLTDKEFIKKDFIKNTGITPNLENPKEFHEKVLWLKIHYRNPLMKKCSDKYRVREYVEEKGFSNYLMNIYGAYKSFDDIDFKALPDKVFIKTNHASGLNMMIDKNKTNLKKAKKYFDKSQKFNYYKRSREWNYDGMTPLLVVEPFLDMKNFNDYKFYVLDGKVEFFTICDNLTDANGIQSLSESSINYYDKNLNLLDDIGSLRPGLAKEIQFSKDLDKMWRAAEKLAAEFPYCRVDFIVSEHEVYFGEMTFYSNGGNLVIKPKERSIEMGSNIKLDNIDSRYLV